MGIEVKSPPFEYGDDCASCATWFPLLWPTGKHPKNIYVYFSGLIACWEYHLGYINGHTFKLVQDEFQPCFWEFTNDIWWVRFWADAGATRSVIDLRQLWYDRTAFWDDLLRCPREHTVYTNECLCSDPDVMAHEGFAEVFWFDRIATLQSELVPTVNSKVLYEPRIVNASSTIDKLCCRLDHTNVKVKYET